MGRFRATVANSRSIRTLSSKHGGSLWVTLKVGDLVATLTACHGENDEHYIVAKLGGPDGDSPEAICLLSDDGIVQEWVTDEKKIE